MLERLFFFLGDIHHTKLGGADSFSDQLSCKWTVFLLSLFAIISTTRIYVSDPIGCFCPPNFPPSQVDYTTKASSVFRTLLRPSVNISLRRMIFPLSFKIMRLPVHL